MRLLEKIALVSLLSSLLLWILELSYALIDGAWLVKSAEGIALFLMISLLLLAGWGVVATLVQGIYLSIMTFIHRRAERRWSTYRTRVVVSAIATATITPYLIYFTQRLFSGKGISQSSYVSYLKAGFFIICLLTVYSLTSLIIRNASTWFSPKKRFRRIIATFCSIATLIILYSLNAEFYVGQYGFIHQAISLCLFLIAELIIVNLLGDKWLTELIKRKATKGLLFVVFVEVALVIFSTGRIPLGSQLLSYIYYQSHLGKQLTWIYGFRATVAVGNAKYHEEYLTDRDDFIWSAPKIKRKEYNLIWIMVDALRADHLPMYGYKRNTCPHLKTFAKKSLLFLCNYTQGYDTDTSLSPQITGCYYSTILRHGGINDFETLPEMLLCNGYNTWALMQQSDITRLYEKGREGVAFERIETVIPQYHAPDISRRAIELIKTQNIQKPFFLFLFYIEPHQPYEKHDSFDYGDKADERYDSEISYVDKYINELLTYIWSSQLHENTVILITADHGEELGQHGGWGHGVKLYNEIIHVPLIMYIPGIRPSVITTPVQSIDICPSLVELLDLKTDARFDGSSFLPYILEAPPPYTPLIFSEAEFGPTRKVCLIYYPWKLIYHISEAYFSLYNLEEDPEERANSIEEHPDVAAMLKKKLLSWLSYRDRNVSERAEAEATAVAIIINRLREHDETALKDLKELAKMDISSSDFMLLTKALEPYISKRVAEFFLVMAQKEKGLLVPAMNALRSLVERADLTFVESDLEGNPDEVVAISKALSDKDSAKFFISLVAHRRDRVAQNALDIIGTTIMQSVRDELFVIYQNSSAESKTKILPTLCRLGEPRVEDELFEMIEGKTGKKLMYMIPLLVNSKSRRARDFLIGWIRKNKGYWLYPRMNDRIAIEIGKSRNQSMLPVLKTIFCQENETQEASSPRLSFSKKAAIIYFVSIKGKKNLTAEDRRSIKKAYENDSQLRQYDELSKLCKSI